MEKSTLVAKAYARYVRVSPRKIRLIIDLIRGEKTDRALAILAALNKRTKVSVEKALRSALSNAKQNPQVNDGELFISKITADPGPVLKRYRAAAMGRAVMIRHRSTHLTIELGRPKLKEVKKPKKSIQKRKVKK